MKPTRLFVGAIAAVILLVILFGRFDDSVMQESGHLDGDLTGFTRNESALIELYTKNKASYLGEERIPEVVYRAGLRNLCGAYSTCFGCISEKHCAWCNGGKLSGPRCHPKNHVASCPLAMQLDTCDPNTGRKFVVCDGGSASNRSATYQRLESVLHSDIDSSDSSSEGSGQFNVSCVTVLDRDKTECDRKTPVAIRTTSSRPQRKRKVISFCEGDFDGAYSLFAPAEKRVVTVSERLTHLEDVLSSRAGNIATNSQHISTRISEYRKKKKYINGKAIPPVVLIGQNLKGGFALKRLRPSFCVWQTDDTQDSVESMSQAIEEGCQAVSIVKRKSAMNVATSELLSEDFVFLDPLADLFSVIETVLNRSKYSISLQKEKEWRVSQFKKAAVGYLSNNVHVVAKLETTDDIQNGLVMAMATLFMSPFSSIEFVASAGLQDIAEMESFIFAMESAGIGKDVQITFVDDVTNQDTINTLLSLSSLDPPPSHIMFVSDPSVMVSSVTTIQALSTHLMNDPFSSLFLSDLSLLYAPFVIPGESEVRPCMTFMSNATFLSLSQTCTATYLPSSDLYVFKRNRRTALFVQSSRTDLPLPELYNLVYLRNSLCEQPSFSAEVVQKLVPKDFRCSK